MHYIKKIALKSFYMAAFLLILPLLASATPAQEARDSLKGQVDAVIDILKSPAFENQATREEQIHKINDEILKIFDFEEFSSRTVGKQWGSFTANQKKQFNDAFAALLRATYIEKLDKYDGQSVTYTGSRTSSDNTKVEIQTLINRKGKAVPVFYQMISKSRWVVYDVKIEGMSLVENYRSQFAELLSKGATAEELISKVNTLANNLQKQNQRVQ